MTGGIATNEFIEVRGAAGGEESAGGPAPLHRYGRLSIRNLREGEAWPETPPIPEADLDETERLGIEALRLRNSESFRTAKADRLNEGRPWGDPAGDAEPLMCPDEPPEDGSGGEEAAGALSGRLAGTVAVGLILVSGPTPALTISAAERVKIAAEVQEALSYLGDTSPARDVTFVHRVREVSVNVPPVGSGDSLEDFEAPWRDAALASVGMPAGRAGCRAIAGQLRNQLDTDWAYIAFFTKYPLGHYAYAIRDHAKVVMSYFNGNRGPDEIDWTFAHESGHIFGAPDEYSTQNRACSCGGEHGPFRLPNRNCDHCAPQGGTRCIMRESTFRMCAVTPYHLGYNGLPPLGAQV